MISMSADLAAGTTAIPTSEQAKATGKDSIAVGKKAVAGKNGNIERATAIGYGANAESNDSLAVGSGANVIVNANNNLNKRSIAIGTQARVEPRPDGGVSSGMHDAIAIGTRAMATAGNSVVIGRDARSKRGLKATFQSGENTVAIGSNASADWGSSIAIGANSRTIVGNGIAIGRDATAMYKIDGLANDGEGRIFTSMALGEKATSIGGASIAAGIETKSAGVNPLQSVTKPLPMVCKVLRLAIRHTVRTDPLSQWVHMRKPVGTVRSVPLPSADKHTLQQLMLLPSAQKPFQAGFVVRRLVQRLIPMEIKH